MRWRRRLDFDQLAEDLANTERIYLDDAYHWVMENRPHEFRAALTDFLKEF